MERNVNAPETFSGSESLEHPSKETKAEVIRRFKANSDFLLREVAGEAVLVPIGEAGVFENSVISLNETCSFLWKFFQEPRSRRRQSLRQEKSIPTLRVRWSRA